MNPSRHQTVWKDWLLPPAVQRWRRRRHILGRFRKPPTAGEAETLARNERFRNRHAGRRCFVIGNGPSLANEDIAPLRDEITIVMNSFHRHPVLSLWKPTYYCRADPGPSFDTPERVRTIREYVEPVAPQACMFAISLRPVIEAHGVLPPDRVFYFRGVCDLAEWPADVYEPDFTRGIPYPGNTGHLAILFAMFLGCSPICLLGMDHDYLAHRSVSRHFYPASADDCGGDDDLGTYTYMEMMRQQVREWERYEVLRAIAARRGCAILNATAGSFLDLFPRVSFGNLVAVNAPAGGSAGIAD